MKTRLALVTGVAAGYVLGTRAGREQYEKIRSQASSLWKDPKVQQQVSHAQHVVREQAPLVQEKLSSATKGVVGKGSSGRDDDELNQAGSGI